jgi:hypothetical protein
VTELCDFWRANFHPIVLRQRGQGLFRRKPGNALNRRCKLEPASAGDRSRRAGRQHDDIAAVQDQRRAVTYVLVLFFSPVRSRAPVAWIRRPVSRVLSPPPQRRRMAIPLGRPSPDASRDLPGRPARKPACPAYGAVVPTWSCSRWGLPCRRRCRRRGALLPHPFTLTRRPMEGAQAGGLLSVALSLGSPPPGVTRHRVSVEPGLSSPGQAPAGTAGSGHPAT